MLRDATNIKKTILVCGVTDCRKGIDGLSSLVLLRYNLDPFEPGTLFLFCGKKRDRLKGIIFEGDGTTLITKRLINGVYQWPRDKDEARLITSEQFKQLMEGFTVVSSIKQYQRIDNS